MIINFYYFINKIYQIYSYFDSSKLIKSIKSGVCSDILYICSSLFHL